MSLSVKVSLQTRNRRGGMNPRTADCNVETRRFSIAEDVAANYDYLRAKIVSIMPCLENKAFRLYWKDDENDLIAFSSDEELLEALSDLSDDGVFRVYAREMIDDDDDNQSHPVHCGRTSGIRLGFPPLHILQAAMSAYRPWIGGFPSTAPPCHRTAEPGTTADGQPGESQHRPEEETASTSAATDNHGGITSEKNTQADDKKSSNKKKTGPFRDFPTPGQQRTDQRSAGSAGDFLANMISNFSSVLNTIATNNFQTNCKQTSAATERSASEHNDDVTGDGRDAKGADAETNHSHSTGADGEPPAASNLSDGLIQVVESLKEMGFNDDDGWLTRLVATHSGQIERIVEVIHATA